MRIVSGKLKGKILGAPAGITTRPTSDRARQALFDIIMHAPWGGRELIENATILDGCAGTGALGLEAISRGAGFAHFIEQDPTALVALRANIAACKITTARVWAADVRRPPQGPPCQLVFLDPPYGKSLIAQVLSPLRTAGWIVPGSIIIAETGREESAPTENPLLADRKFGAARILIWRE